MGIREAILVGVFVVSFMGCSENGFVPEFSSGTMKSTDREASQTREAPSHKVPVDHSIHHQPTNETSVDRVLRHVTSGERPAQSSDQLGEEEQLSGDGQQDLRLELPGDTVTPPTMITGAFLTCVPGAVSGSASEPGMGCRFQDSEGRVKFMDADFAISFFTKNLNGQKIPLPIVAERTFGEWQWLVRLPGDSDGTVGAEFGDGPEDVSGREVIAEIVESQLWVAAAGGDVPDGAYSVIADPGSGLSFHVCRGEVSPTSGIHPGNLIPGQGCHIEYGNVQGWLITSYQVLMGLPGQEIVFVEPATIELGNLEPQGAETNGTLLHSCLITDASGRPYFGKTRGDWQDCRYSQNEVRVVEPNGYRVLIFAPSQL